jgi:hypothetical protein
MMCRESLAWSIDFVGSATRQLATLDCGECYFKLPAVYGPGTEPQRGLVFTLELYCNGGYEADSAIVSRSLNSHRSKIGQAPQRGLRAVQT